MDHKPVFSVILPAYNAEETVSHMIQAVLNQSFSDYELLLIDDGSQDQTLAVMRSFASERVHVFHQENHGVSSARNHGIREANGEYLVFVDADDDLETDYLEAFFPLMQNADLGICSFAVRSASDQSVKQSVLKPQRISASETVDRSLRFRDISSACWNKCFRRDIVLEHHLSFDETLTIGEDMLFLASYCLQIDTAALSDKVTYIYVTGGTGAMQQSGIRKQFNPKWLSEWTAIRKLEKLTENCSFSLPAIKIKKVRIANKLLNTMKRFNYQDAAVKKELLMAIHENYKDVIAEKEFPFKTKVSITLKKLEKVL